MSEILTQVTDPHTGPQREAAAVRIRSVYGAEFAGGFTGLMEAADTAETGGLGLLWGLIKVDKKPRRSGLWLG